MTIQYIGSNNNHIRKYSNLLEKGTDDLGMDTVIIRIEDQEFSIKIVIKQGIHNFNTIKIGFFLISDDNIRGGKLLFIVPALAIFGGTMVRARVLNLRLQIR